MRQLRLRMSDETVRTVMVDENQPVANLMVLICTKLGITNHDEYSLIATGKHTIDGRRRERQDGRFIDQKMEQLKKKLKTDEDLAWVDHSKTLDEQDIHEQDIVLLRRRFFYSDQNVDSRDPIQLGLLYVQTRDAILKGTYSVTVDGACKFAGLQCQAQLGDFVEGHHSRPGFLNLKDFLPADYAKIKHIERRVFQEHKKYLGLSDVEAKARYVGEARALPFYGVTFFLVKEQVTGKSKLVPRLLGITRDCVMVVDADTKGVLKTWPLTTVKRWAPSPNSFTLDFGDYSNSYYSVQTSEGEQISQLIAGYIDIILRRRKAKDHFGIEGDEGATMIEDSVAPSRAKIIQNAPPRPPSAGPPADSQLDLASSTGPNVQKQLYAQGPQLEPPEFRPAVEIRGKAEIGYESRPLTQYVTNYELTLPQRDLQDRLEQAQDAVEEAQRVLDQRSAPIAGELGGRERERARHQHLEAREVEQKTRKLSSQFAEINAATAQLVSLSAIPEEELNYPALNSAVETVASNLPSVAKEVKIVASLMEDEESGERLIEAARHLCKAFSDLLNAAKPGPTVPRQSLISAASRVGDATQALLQTINQGGLAGGPQEGQLQAQQQLEEERETADQLLALAKSVASSAAALVLKTKDVASTCRDKELQNLVIGSATQCALATSQMVATAKIVAPTIHDPNCKRQLIDACREVQRAVEGIQSACERALRDEQSLCSVNEAVERVQHALAELTEHVRTISRRRQLHTTTSTTTTTTTTQNDHRSSHNTTLHRIHDQSSGRLIEPAVPGEPERPDPAKSELVQQARTLARATAQLIQDIRPEAPERYQNAQWRSSSPERQQQQQQQYHDGTNKTTTTITTTLYDDQQQQQQRAGGSSLRPVSVYESESSPAPHHNYGPANGRYLSGGGGAQLDERSQQQQQRSTTTSQTTRTTTIEEHSSAGWHGEPPLAAHHDQHQYQGQYQGQSQAGEQPAEAAISGIIGDLETTIMFATAGTLRAQDEHDSYLAHRENVLRCAKALVEDTRPLVAGAPGDQQQLVQAAQESVFTMGRLADTVKSSAASLGPNNADSQVSLIRSVKDVAVSLADLIGSTKSASQEGASSVQLKDSAKTMVTSVTSLLKTVKSVEEEQQRGVRAIEAALEAIEQELVNYASQCAYEESAPGAPARCSPDELQRTTRPVTMATAKTVHAASSGVQDDAIVAANMGRKAIVDLLRASRSASFAAASYEARARVQEAGRQCAVNYKRLVELLHRIFQHPSHASANPEIKQELIGQSKTIAGCVQELVSCSELLLPPSGAPQQQHPQHQMLASTTITTTTTSTSNNNNNSNSNIINSSSLDASSNLGGLRDAPAHGAPDWADPDDPTVIAESELLGAASSIDAAAKKLENLKPRVTSVKLPHEELNFDEIILDAAKSIIEATAALLRAASASQRELIVDGRLDETETFYASDNNQWSEGLVSAARMVAAATHSLVEAANALVQGQASEERLISAAKQVASSTNQLLVACKVKADPDSKTMQRLSNAGHQVKRATDNLVRAAQQAIEHDEDQSLVISNRKVSGIAQEISAREQILRKEKELQVAKTQLMAIRKAKYSNRPDDYQGYGGSLD